MLGKIAEFFKGEASEIHVDSSGNPTDFDLHVATAVVLVEMASADSEIAPQEAEALLTVMGEQFLVADEEVPELVQIAIAAKNETGKIDDFITLINENFNETQKVRVLAMVWRVVLADGVVDKFESRFARQLQSRFKLSDEHGVKAREMAETGKV